MTRIYLDDMELFVRKRTAQRDNEVPKKPVEEGTPISDKINQKPQIFDLTVRLAGKKDEEAEVMQKLERLKQFRDSSETHEYTSPEDNIDDVAVQSIQDERSNSKVQYDVRLTLVEIEFTSAGNSESERNGANNGAEEEVKNAGRRPNQEVDEEEAQEDADQILFSGDTIGGGGGVTGGLLGGGL